MKSLATPRLHRTVFEVEVIRRKRVHMGRILIGKVLQQMGKLSGHDIDEILHEQMSAGAKKPFGEIALTFGLCQPEHIWKAWAHQLSDGFEKIDLAVIGIDAQAVPQLPRDLAERFCAIAIRLLDDELVVAISGPGMDDGPPAR